MSVIYFHFPYCPRKCPYCDFFSLPINGSTPYSQVLQNYETRVEQFANLKKWDSITSIFFGGGTPSLMSAAQIEKILNICSKKFSLSPNCEISLEANPGTLNAQKISDFKTAGINRLSLGVQSFSDANLKFLGRIHNAQTALKNIEAVAKVFNNYSFDLIYALPHQTLDDLDNELAMVQKLSPPHLSMYQLTLEKHTHFYQQIKKPICEDLAAKMFLYVAKKLKKWGYLNYEVSNFAKPKFTCAHNFSYWRGDEYMGIGPSAASRIKIGQQWFEGKEDLIPQTNLILKKLSAPNRLCEIIMTGLRTNEGFNLSILYDFKTSINKALDLEKITHLEQLKMIKLTKKNLRILSSGRLFLNYINSEIIL